MKANLKTGGLVLGLCLALCEPMVQAAEDMYIAAGTISGAPSLLCVTNGTVTSTSSPVFYLPDTPEPYDLVLQPEVVAANVGTSNTVYGFTFSGDGSHFNTTTNLSASVACNGTNVVRNWIFVSKTNLAMVRAIRWDVTATTQTNGVTTIMRVFYGVKGSKPS